MTRTVALPLGLEDPLAFARATALRERPAVAESPPAPVPPAVQPAAAAPAPAVEVPVQPAAGTPAALVIIAGTEGDDLLRASRPTETEAVYGYGGDDRLHAQATGWQASGYDALYGGAGDDRLFGGQSEDLKTAIGFAVLEGGEGNDYLVSRQVAEGGAGDDHILIAAAQGPVSGGVIAEGGEGDDLIEAGSGQVLAWGGTGNDRFQLLDGASVEGGVNVHGGDGDDDLRASGTQLGSEILVSMNGASGNDLLRAGGRPAELLGGSGDDQLLGGAGSRMFGEQGRDLLLGGSGTQHLDGGADEDRLFGGSGVDTLLGGAGADRLAGGGGADRLWGGAGADVFVSEAALHPTDRVDRILDFDIAVGDRVDLTAELGDLSGLDLVAEGYLRAVAVTIDGQSYAAVEVDRDGAAGPGGFSRALLIRSDDPLGLNEQVFWTFG